MNYQIPADFNYYEYINNYLDIKFLNQSEAISHYLKHGLHEGRIYQTTNLSDFDPIFYKNHYKDLTNLSDEEALLHYIRYGKYEGRNYKPNILKTTTNYVYMNHFSNMEILIADYMDIFEIDDLLNNYLSKYKSSLDNTKIHNINLVINSKFKNKIIRLNKSTDIKIGISSHKQLIQPNQSTQPNLLIYIYRLLRSYEKKMLLYTKCVDYHIKPDEDLEKTICHISNEIIYDNMNYSADIMRSNKYNHILNIFDKILIINLKHRTDRKTHILNQLKKLNIGSDKYMIIEAIYDTNGMIGCAKSHIKCLEYAKKQCYSNIIILEDDYVFPDDQISFQSNIAKFIFGNIRWDIILLYYSNYGPPIYLKTDIENTYKFYWSYSTAAYIANQTIYDDLLYIYTESIVKSEPIDWSWNYLKNKYDWYGISKTIGYQTSSYSDIEKKEVRYEKTFL